MGGVMGMRVGDHIILNYGKGLPVRDRDTSGSVPVYGSSGVTGYHSESLTDQPVVIVGRKGAAGRVELSNGPCWPIDTTYYIVPPDHIDIKYLVYTLKGLGLEQLDQSTAVPSLSRDRVYDLPLEVPDLPTQRAIVERLDALHSELDAGVASLERAKAKLNVYRQSVLQRAFSGELTRAWREQQTDLPTSEELLAEIRAAREAWYAGQVAKYETDYRAWMDGGEVGKKPRKVGKLKAVKPITEGEKKELGELPAGWCWVRLGEVAEITGGVTKGRKLDPDQTVNVPYLRVANVQDGYVDVSEMKTIDVLPSDTDKYELQAGDLLFAEGGDRDKVGRSAVWKGEVRNCINQNHVFRVRPYLSSMNPEFLQLASSTRRARNYFLENARQTTNLASINMGVLGELIVAFPSAKEQNQITEQHQSCIQVATSVEDAIRRSTVRGIVLRNA